MRKSITVTKADATAQRAARAYSVALAAVLFEAEALLLYSSPGCEQNPRRREAMQQQRRRLSAAIARARQAEDARDAAMRAVLDA